eukprot:7331858-Alexandrium_andersonii.AAC.1
MINPSVQVSQNQQWPGATQVLDQFSKFIKELLPGLELIPRMGRVGRNDNYLSGCLPQPYGEQSAPTWKHEGKTLSRSVRKCNTDTRVLPSPVLNRGREKEEGVLNYIFGGARGTGFCKCQNVQLSRLHE